MPGIAGLISEADAQACEHIVARMSAALSSGARRQHARLSAPSLGVYASWSAHEGSIAALFNAQAGHHDGALAITGEPMCQGGALTPPAPDDASLQAWIETLEGPFAGIAVDLQRGSFTLFNDRFGMERIYVARSKGDVYFASEAKALLAVLPECRQFDLEAVAELLTCGSVRAGHTLFKGIAELPAGSAWRGRGAREIREGRYFEPSAWEALAPLTVERFEEEFSAVCRARLPKYLSGGGSKVGLSVTGGLDTRMLLACLPPQHADFVAYTYAGLRGEPIDAKLGSRLSQLPGIPHHVIHLDDTFLSGFGRYVDDTILRTDGTAGALSSHELFYTERAAALSPIRITGNYGSEILRSVSTLKAYHVDPALVAPEFAALLAGTRTALQAEAMHPVTRSAFAEVPHHLFGPWASARSMLSIRAPFLDSEVVKLAYQAPLSSRQDSRAGIRLINDAAPLMGSIPTDRELSLNSSPSWPWRRFMAEVAFKLDYWFAEGLPNRLRAFGPLLELADQRRLLGGHKFLLYRRWLRRELAGYTRETLLRDGFGTLPFIRREGVATLIDEHIAGRRNAAREIGILLQLEAVSRLLMRPADADRREPN